MSGHPLRKLLLGLLCIVAWYGGDPTRTEAESPPADSAHPRFLSVTRGPVGGCHLVWTGVAGVPYDLQASADLVTWTTALSVRAGNGPTETEDTAAPATGSRFYRLVQRPPRLVLDLARALPGQVLRVSGGAFEPRVPTQVRFRTAAGLEALIRPGLMTVSNLWVSVPVLIDPAKPGIVGGTVSVSVRQDHAAGAVNQEADASLEIEALPATGLPVGTVTRAYLAGLSAVLGRSAAEWQTIAAASGGLVETGPLRGGLLDGKAEVDAAARRVEQVLSGEVAELELGRFGDRPVRLDAQAISILDRLLLTNLRGVRSMPVGANAKGVAAQPRLATGDGSLPEVDVFFQSLEGPNAATIFAGFDRVNIVASAAVGVLASGAVALGAASAPAGAALAGTVGAALYFGASLAPAVMAASSQAMAAPFIEVQLGRDVASVEAFRPALNHVRDGGIAYLAEGLIGQLTKGAFLAGGASDEVASFFELYVSTSRALLKLQDLDDAASPVGAAYHHAAVIFPRLAPTERAGTYVGVATGSLTETYPDAGWRHDISITLTLRVQGEGTVAVPYHGTLHVSGQTRISLDYCYEPAGCDPGGVIPFGVDDGDLYGAHGTLEGEGVGASAGTGAFSIEFTGGTFEAGELKGTVILDLGLDQRLTRTVRLVRLP